MGGMTCLTPNSAKGLVPMRHSLFASAAQLTGSYFKLIVCGLLK